MLTEANSRKSVILCADDYAFHVQASQGILSLARAGRISATSVMVLSPRWQEDSAPLRELSANIDVGLHLDWTSYFACEAGHGKGLFKLMSQAFMGKLPTELVTGVIERQLDLFEAHWGAPPDYLDGHQHVQQFNGIRQVLFDVIQRRYENRPYCRCSYFPQGQRSLKSWVISSMGARSFIELAKEAKVPISTALLGIYDFKATGEEYGQYMKNWLIRAPEGAIIMCHPANSDTHGDPIGMARLQEFSYLSSSLFLQHLKDAQVTLSHGECLSLQ